jgi:hypothetical protein
MLNFLSPTLVIVVVAMSDGKRFVGPTPNNCTDSCDNATLTFSSSPGIDRAKRNSSVHVSSRFELACALLLNCALCPVKLLVAE